QASKNNLVLDISGYLYFEKGTFLQYIEGPADALECLFNKITLDERHKIYRHISDTKLTERRFPDWSMQWLTNAYLAEIRLENILIDQLDIMQKLGGAGPDFSETAFRLVNSLAR
ncbi:BLUF domain-containing protein, partial [Oleiphilus sp. HI0080]